MSVSSPNGVYDGRYNHLAGTPRSQGKEATPQPHPNGHRIISNKPSEKKDDETGK